MWVPPEEKDPQLLHAPTRKHVCMYGAVQVATGKLLTRECERFDAMVFQNFLMTLVREHDGKRRIHLILDNAKYHHAILLEPFLEEHKDKLVLEFLPPYSPDLNPIERVWRLTRRLCVHNRYFAILSDLVKVVYAQFSLWVAPNDALRRLCAIN
jgi:transposase